MLAIPSGVRAYRTYVDNTARSKMTDFERGALSDEELWAHRLNAAGRQEVDEDGPEHDDPRARMLARKAIWGSPRPGYWHRFAAEAQNEAERWEAQLPRVVTPGSPELSAKGAVAGGGRSWVNIGPTDAAFEWNGTSYSQVDSGRAAGIRVDPRDAGVVYLATSGGGIWKTWNFGATTPSWFPITETLGNIAIGEFDLDPLLPDTLHVGVGDAFDNPGGFMVKSTNGGGTWSAAVPLNAVYPAGSGGLARAAETIRSVRVDPTNSNRVLVATNVGLFKSEDGGASYALIDLPNSGAQTAESMWSVVFAGTSATGSRIVVTGVYACAPGQEPLPPSYGTVAGGTNYLDGSICTNGTPGDIWYSTNSGTSWTSLRVAGGLPNTNIGRVNLAAGTAKANAATTVIYAQISQQEEAAGSAGNGIWRSSTGGSSWVVATGTLANRTGSVFGSRDCASVDVNAEQAYYNSAIAVDPANDANVLVGGMLCGLRTTSGTAGSPSWENIAHWLPSGGGGSVTGGDLPYVHADWHRALIVRVGATIRAFAGSDGGLFVSDNLFAGVTPPNVVWAFKNRGIVTHLSYSVASGDPATGNAFTAFTGLQDNGTRFRDSAAAATTFNQIIGGDGIGAVAAKNATGSAVYWGSVQYSQRRCVPAAGNNNCNQGGAWAATNVPVASCGAAFADSVPFLVRFAVSPPNASGPTTLSTSTYHMYKSVGTTGAWSQIDTCFVSPSTTHVVRFPAASATTDGLYGAALSGGRYAVTSNCGGTTTACTWTISNQVGVDLDSPANGIQDDERLAFTSSVAFPPGPTGAAVGNVYLASSSAPETVAFTAIDPRIGNLFKTTDRGTTWTAISGYGGPSPLPLVPINVVRYDPADTTNNTIYVGTDLGVYRSNDGGATWERYGAGLPLVRVSDMFVGKAGQIIRIGTFGRGLWEIYPSATAEHGVNGNGDFNRDQQIDIVDLAASASRLGTNTLTVAQPYYDWNMDLTALPSNTNAIEDADLNAVIAKFGARP